MELINESVRRLGSKEAAGLAWQDLAGAVDQGLKDRLLGLHRSWTHRDTIKYEVLGCTAL